MRSDSTHARQTASATSLSPEDRKDSQIIDGRPELLRLTAHLNCEIERVARQEYSAYMSAGCRYDLDELVDLVRQVAFDVRDKHPDDLQELYRVFGNPDAEPRTRRINVNLEQDALRIALEWQSRLERQGARSSLELLTAHVRKVGLEVLNTHPDDIHVAYRALGNPKVSPKDPYPNYAVAQDCARFSVRLAPDGTDFMPVRSLVIAEPGRGWSRVRVLALRQVKTMTNGEVVELLTPMTAPSVRELLDMAAAMKLRVSGRHYLLSHKESKPG